MRFEIEPEGIADIQHSQGAARQLAAPSLLDKAQAAVSASRSARGPSTPTASRPIFCSAEQSTRANLAPSPDKRRRRKYFRRNFEINPIFNFRIMPQLTKLPAMPLRRHPLIEVISIAYE
ncbi:MAG: hypothetical protein KGK11_02425 [Sphingomonadales bacterium]|nr:hypothetical protein [Sphingomonadales bacterium]